jgi:serine/threonine protein kinase
MIQFEKADHRMAHIEFEIESQALSRIDHPNVVRMLGCGSYPRPYVILEKLKDISLMLDLRDSRTLFRKRVFSYPELLLVAIDLADALDYLHSRIHPDMMIIHRDLKPENLGLTADGKIKLIDFGLCRYVRKRSSLTETYKMTGNTGSIRYMAPEVVLEKPYTEKVDVFSFAVTIWAMGCNKLPYRELDRVSHKSRVVLNGERPKLDRSWPKEFCDLIKDCWHQDFTKRPAFSEVKDRLVVMSNELATKSSVGSQLSFVSRMFNRTMQVSAR